MSFDSLLNITATIKSRPTTGGQVKDTYGFPSRTFTTIGTYKARLVWNVAGQIKNGSELYSKVECFLYVKKKDVAFSHGAKYYVVCKDSNVNYFKNSDNFETQTIDLEVGAHTFGFLGSAGPPIANKNITSSNGTGVASNHGAVSGGYSFSSARTITVTTAGSFVFTKNVLSPTITQSQLNEGSTLLSYEARGANEKTTDFEVLGIEESSKSLYCRLLLRKIPTAVI